MHKPATSHLDSLMEMICHGFMWWRKNIGDEKEQHGTKKRPRSKTHHSTLLLAHRETLEFFAENAPATRLATWGHHWPAPKLQFYHLSGTRDPAVEAWNLENPLVHTYAYSNGIWLQRFFYRIEGLFPFRKLNLLQGLEMASKLIVW